jgi:hypothetical protein
VAQLVASSKGRTTRAAISSGVRCGIVLLVACGGSKPAPTAPTIEPTVIRIFREVMIDASGDSHRTTFELATTGDDAQLVVIREQSSATRLDTPTAWAMVERMTFFGPITGSMDRSSRTSFLDLVDADGRGLQLSCEPFAEKVMPAHARLVHRDADCSKVDLDAWEPASAESVPALVCMRQGLHEAVVVADEPVSLRQITFVDAPGVELVEERTECKVFGSGLRWR